MFLLTCLVLAAVDAGAASPRFVVEPGRGKASEVAGVVTDERGAPVAGAEVEFSAFWQHGSTVKKVVTGADGHFSVDPVPTGSHGTSVEVRGASLGLLRGHLRDDALSGGAFLRLRVGPPVRLSGTLVASDVHLAGLSLAEPPPAGVDLARWRDDATLLASATVGADGTFSFEVLEGDYELRWTRPGGADFFTLVHAPGQGLRLTPPRQSLDGRALDAHGLPLADAQVRVRDAEGLRPRAGVASTNAQGRFGVVGLGDGAYLVAVTHQGVCHEQPARVKQGLGAVEVRFGGGWDVSGRVLDAKGQPLAKVEVRAAPLAGMDSCSPRAATTDRAGRFVLRDLDLEACRVSLPAGTPAEPPAASVEVKRGDGPVTLVAPTTAAPKGHAP